MKRAYYDAEIKDFLMQEDNYILGELARNNQYELNELQKYTWLLEISILKDCLQNIDGHILFEYTIPRIGKRVDVVLIIKGIVYVLEFKCGSYTYDSYAIDQVVDYALDLKNFHKASHNIKIVPILIATEAENITSNIKFDSDNIAKPLFFNTDTLINDFSDLISKISDNAIITESCKDFAKSWKDSAYQPTPTIIEAAQALYSGHGVEDIRKFGAGKVNFALTAEAIDEVIKNSKKNKRKSICFITGVPGAGKTLAGLNIACDRHIFEEEEHAVFLSGNGPLVDVLQEALARDDVEKSDIKKGEAKRKAKSFIQNIHHFRDDALSYHNAPNEKVVIFDEAQRAWNAEQTSKFMAIKKGILNFNMSEPEFLISIMNRHEEWATIICLVGGGQEINDGEAGLIGWFDALKNKFSDWDLYLSNKISDTEYVGEHNLKEVVSGLNFYFKEELHLAVPLRSFRSERVAEFVKSLLDIEPHRARNIYQELSKTYTIKLTRDLGESKKIMKQMARGSERYGLTASSGGKRLRANGIWVEKKVDAVQWFLNDKKDIRSSYYLEETATEFDIQGLELEYTIVAWDANLRYENGKWGYYNFSGTKWNNINKEINKLYLKNAYRVLMTRARQGIVIYIPEGNNNDHTRKKEFYDGTYNYLAYCLGIEDTLKCPIPLPPPPFLPPPDPEPHIPIGVIVQKLLSGLLCSGIVDKETFKLLFDKTYCKETFNLGYPLLASGIRGEDFEKQRYYKNPLIIENKYYYLCSQWYEKQRNNLLSWIIKWEV